MTDMVCQRHDLQVAEFYRRNYGPSALTIAIVGDAKPEQVRPAFLIDLHLGMDSWFTAPQLYSNTSATVYFCQSHPWC